MGDSLITVIAIGLATVLMFVFPLMSLSERNDDVSQLKVKESTSTFVDKVRNVGKLTMDDYEKFLHTINSTGNSFEVDMEIKTLDENPGSKVSQAEMTKIGENVYYSKYTTQIEEELNKSGKIKLKEGDIFSVSVKNTNKTIAQLLRNAFYKLRGEESGNIMAKYGGVIAVNGSNL